MSEALKVFLDVMREGSDEQVLEWRMREGKKFCEALSVPPTEGPSEPSGNALLAAHEVLEPRTAGEASLVNRAVRAAYAVDGLRVPPTQEEARPLFDEAERGIVYGLVDQAVMRGARREEFSKVIGDTTNALMSLRAAVPGAGPTIDGPYCPSCGGQGICANDCPRAAGAGPAPQEETK